MSTRSVRAMTVVAASAVACASSTVIKTVPPGARVYVNEEFVGESPAEYSDTKIVLSRNQVRLEMDGYESKRVTFARDEKLNILAAIGTVAIIVPAIWLFDYKAERTYELTELSEDEAGP